MSVRDKARERQRRYREANPGLLYNDYRPFAGVDGEGGTTVKGSHDYFLLRAGSDCIKREDGPLSSLDCLDFLSRLSPDVIWVAYFFDYDSTKISQDIGWEKLFRLVHRELRIPRNTHWGGGGTPYPVDVHGGAFQIDWLARKFYKVRRRVADNVYSPWIEVSDVGTFFQCPFTAALDRWDIGTPEQRAAIAHGKAQRRTFDASQIPDIEKYNLLECLLLAELMERFRETCRRSGYVPRKWQGPGQIAEAIMRARGIPKSNKVPMLKDERYQGVTDFAGKAFYGGRPELTRVGPYHKPVEQYDINSAYPYAMLHVPCLIHGDWKHSIGEGVPPGSVGISYGHFQRKGESRAYLFGFPVRRKDGSIYYPAEGNGWYWSMEINAARHQTFTPVETWTYVKRCDCVPFGFVPDLYDMRIRLGKDALGLYLKLGLNSLYGKTAQSIGSPAYANPIWASFITSFTRAQIQELIHKLPSHRAGQCGMDVLMVATDAIFTTRPIPGVEDSKELGGVSVKHHPDGLFIIQPGLYFAGDGSRPKTRGVPLTAVRERESEFYATWQRMCDTGKEEAVDIPVDVFVGMRQAVHRKKPELMGTWVEYREDGTHNGKRVGFEWKTKRMAMERPMFYGAAQTWPYPGGPDIVTVPYSREIGKWRELMRLDFEDQPDWVPVIGMEE